MFFLAVHLFFLTVCIPLVADFSVPMLANINGIVRFIDDTTSLEPSFWLGNQESIFKCFVLQKYTQWKDDAHKAQECIDHALSLNIACKNLLDEIGTKYGALNAPTPIDWHRVLIAIKDECQIIKEIVLPDAIKTTETGSLTPESLISFLDICTEQNHIDRNLLGDLSHACVSELIDHYVIQPVFLLNSQHGSYIIRELTFGQEKVARLTCGQCTKPLQPFIHPNYQDCLPCFIFPICYLGYQAKGSEHILAIMPQANGKQLSEYMIAFKKNPDEENLNHARRAYYALGRSWARLQQMFMKHDDSTVIGESLTHGDFHHYHIFFDEASDKVSVIDNEYLAYYFTYQRNATADITNFFDETLGPSLTKPEFYHGFQKETWLKATLRAFIAGYLSTYTPAEKIPAIKQIRQAFIEKIDRWKEYYHNRNSFDEVFDLLISDNLQP